MTLEISQILHSSVIVKDTQTALSFYQGILGLTLDESRPDLGYAGAWLNVGQQQIHLLELPNPDPVKGRPAHGGRDRHVALAVNDIDTLQNKLEQAGLEFSRSKSGRKALFTRDPDGNALEFIET
ncbi:MAG: glyoxalase [Gammaproteobacteria bacterium SG8_15]|nr:MAG: glyoxalase [Gammaproteobacteria bacterium SG8_15]